MPRRQTQFKPRHDDLTLVRIVREISAHACPADPVSCDQDPFDDARAVAGWRDVPRGRNIAARLQLPWPELLRVAHGPKQ